MSDKRGYRNHAALHPLVSVIIPSYNSMSGTKSIDKTLKSIVDQTYDEIEILVVDNYSTDATYDVCRNYPVRFFGLNGNRSKARNYGIRQMRGDYALFVDSDHILMPRVVEECVNVSLSAHADCVMVPVTFVSNKKARIDCSQMRNLEFRLGLGTQTLILFYSRDCIRNVEFPESVELGEDMIFSSRILEFKTEVARVESCICHFEDGTAKSLVLRSWNYGRKLRSTIAEIGPKGSTQIILSLSPLDITRLGRLVANVSSSPSTILSYMLYTLIKHLSFAISYSVSLLQKKCTCFV